MIIDGLEGPVGTDVLETPGYVCHIRRNLERWDLVGVLGFDVAIVTAVVSSFLATHNPTYRIRVLPSAIAARNDTLLRRGIGSRHD